MAGKALGVKRRRVGLFGLVGVMAREATDTSASMEGSLRPAASFQEFRCRTRMADRHVETVDSIVETDPAFIVRAFMFEDVGLTCLALSERPEDWFGKSLFAFSIR